MTSNIQRSTSLYYADMMLENTTIGIAVYDAHDLRLVEINKAFLAFCGRRDQAGREQLIGLRVTELDPKLTMLGIEDIFRTVVEKREPHRAREISYPFSK